MTEIYGYHDMAQPLDDEWILWDVLELQKSIAFGLMTTHNLPTKRLVN